MAPKPSGLPRRPEANAAGPSGTRPTYAASVPAIRFAPSSSNLSGGYGGYHAPAPVYNPAYAYPAYPSYPQYSAYPYAAYGAYPATPNPYQTFGQSLFYQPQQPQQVPHYPQMPASVSLEPPAKRHKADSGPSLGGDPMSWRNCSVEGCKFVGPGDKVEQHEGDRHLIFRNGPKVELSEEELQYVNRKGPAPPVFGTTITLHTEEEIAKWVAERKANWPGAKRIAEKKAEREAAIARGENPDSKKKRDRRTMDPAAMAEDWGRADAGPSASDRGGRGGRGRDRGRGADRGRGSDRGRGRGDREGGGSGRGRGGRGGAEWSGDTRVGEGGGRGRGRGRGAAELGRTQDFGHSGAAQAPQQPPAAAPTLPAKPTTTNTNSIPVITGLGEYQSSSASSSSSSSSEDSSDDSMSSISSDDDEDLPKERELPEAAPVEPPAPVEDLPKPMCPHWMKNGRCRQGDRCLSAHPTDHIPTAYSAVAEPPKKQPRMPPAKKANPFARPSLLGQLLANPIENTLSQLTQTIRFLVANDMLQNVELEPGQAEEEQRKRELISFVASDQAE